MAPMGFGRVGRYLYSGGTLDYQSLLGNYWSRRISSLAKNSYNLYFASGYVCSQYNGVHGHGFSLRCLAR